MRTALVTLMMCLLAVPASAKYSGGTGEPNDPYQIATAADLITLGETPADYDKHFVLTADIDLAPNLPGRKVFDKAVIAPDTDPDDERGGFQGPPFTGAFDGHGHTIKNLKVTGAKHLGFFGRLDSAARVSHLGLEAVDVSGTGSGGGLAGSNQGSITDSYSRGSVRGTGWHVGGLVGFNGGRIVASSSAGSVRGTDEVGGLAGGNDGTIADSYSSASVSGMQDVGGLVGWNFGGTIVASYSSGSVQGDCVVGGLVGSSNLWYGSIVLSYSSGSVSGDDYVGGLVGDNSGNITASSSRGSVNGSNGSAGGLAGENRGSIVASYSRGPVNGTEDVGGLVGSNWDSIVASYSTGSVSGNGCVGGLAGDNSGSIVASYSRGSVSGKNDVGGLVGLNEGELGIGSVHSSFWDIQTSGRATSAAGTGKTTVEMQDLETFLSAGWDFAGEVANGTCDYWQISPGDYPGLQYQGDNRPLMPEGSGTAEQPYLVRDARDLGTVWFEPLAHYRLAQSVDLAGITWSMAVIPWFAGSFDGGGCVIRNLHIHGGCYVGLFGWSSAPSVSNLGLEAVEVNGADYVGGLVGHSYFCGIAASYSSGSVSGMDYTGGLVGSNLGGDIVASSARGMVSGANDVGGLAGWNSGAIAASHSNASASGKERVGGLAGSTHETEFGGDGSIVTSYSSGAVSGAKEVGGLVGTSNSRLRSNYSSASVSGADYIGGLVGSNWGSGQITSNYSSGSVAGIDHVGGLIGSNTPFFSAGSVNSSFWDIQTSGQSASAAGAGKTTAEMQTAQTFLDAGWDFVGETANGTEDLWWIEEGGDYPRLWWEAEKQR